MTIDSGDNTSQQNLAPNKMHSTMFRIVYFSTWIGVFIGYAMLYQNSPSAPNYENGMDYALPDLFAGRYSTRYIYMHVGSFFSMVTAIFSLMIMTVFGIVKNYIQDPTLAKKPDAT